MQCSDKKMNENLALNMYLKIKGIYRMKLMLTSLGTKLGDYMKGVVGKKTGVR